ncbi:MAG TPA: polysaccharide deacetylase family protein [Phycisphaerae bacterium]|nr:polysaccharide deacetylase family protein [Phycisphaerae bacterium]HRY69286.1 polysaccharide deacetylase family protein [Phycisphaerae bacterium]HSA26604.1 polysaccharide deacetylase family protein [Phycisphaerae bacterium]
MSDRSSVRRRLLLYGLPILALGGAGCLPRDLAGWLWSSPAHVSPPPGGGVPINIQVDAEMEGVAGLARITDELQRRGILTTVYVTADYANRQQPAVTELYHQGFEIALHGYYTGEQLATMTYEEQKDLLTRAKTAVEGCRPCGHYKPVVGFRPQYFSQNEDTYEILDELGLAYNSGFKARQLALPGHENDTLPYIVADHSFKAVPISTVEYGGKRVYLCDISFAEGDHMTGAQFGEALHLALEEAVAADEPLVVLVHNWYTGDSDKYDYWQPFRDFLDEAAAKGTFVTTQALVEASD